MYETLATKRPYRATHRRIMERLKKMSKEILLKLVLVHGRLSCNFLFTIQLISKRKRAEHPLAVLRLTAAGQDQDHDIVTIGASKQTFSSLSIDAFTNDYASLLLSRQLTASFMFRAVGHQPKSMERNHRAQRGEPS